MQISEESISGLKKTVGLRQTLKAIESGDCRCVILSTDADSAVTQKIEHAAGLKGVNVLRKHTMKELGRIAGIEVACAVLGLEIGL